MSKQKIQFIFISSINRDHGPVFTMTHLINKLHDNLLPVVYCEEAPNVSTAAGQLAKAKANYRGAKELLKELDLGQFLTRKEGLSRDYFEDGSDIPLLKAVNQKYPQNTFNEKIHLGRSLIDMNSSLYKTALYKAINDANIAYVPFGFNQDIEEECLEQNGSNYDQEIVNNFITLRISHIIPTIIKQAIPKLDRQNGVVVINSSPVNLGPLVMEVMKALKSMEGLNFDYNVKAYLCGSEYFFDYLDDQKSAVRSAFEVIKNYKGIDSTKLELKTVKCHENGYQFDAEEIDQSLINDTVKFLTKDRSWSEVIRPRSSSLENNFKNEVKARRNSLNNETNGIMAI